MKFIFFFFFYSWSALAIDGMKVDLYTESGVQKVQSDSLYQQNDLLYASSLRSYSRGSITYQSPSTNEVQAILKLQGTYRPVNFTRTSSTSASYEEKLKLKTVYLQYTNDYLIVGMGRKFINWGGGVFFTPLDVINESRDPLRPLDEAEGSSLTYLGFPFGSSSMLEFYGVFRDDETATDKPDERLLDFIPRFAFSYKNFSSFFFYKMNKENRNFAGANLSYSLSPLPNWSLTLIGEGAYKSGSGRLSFTDDGELEAREKRKHYQAYLSGAQLQVSYPRSPWIDGVTVAVEYYNNSEHWSKSEYQNFLNASSNMSISRLILQSMIKPFQNSKQYVYTSFFFNSFSLLDVDFGVHGIFNLDDSSSLFIPELSYPIAKKQGAIGIKSYILAGKKGSEFGSTPYNYQSTLSLSYSF